MPFSKSGTLAFIIEGQPLGLGTPVVSYAPRPILIICQKKSCEELVQTTLSGIIQGKLGIRTVRSPN